MDKAKVSRDIEGRLEACKQEEATKASEGRDEESVLHNNCFFLFLELAYAISISPFGVG